MWNATRQPLALIILAFSLSVPSAHAVIDKTVTWADMADIDLSKVFHTEYASNHNMYEPLISDSMLELVLRDADSRVGSEFHVPDSYKDAVKFWLKIYVEYTTQHVVVFDDLHHDLVYEVLDFRDLAKRARNLVAYEIMRERKINKTIAAYKAALRSLIKNPRPRKPTEIQRKIIAAREKARHKHSYSQMLKNLRTQTGQRDNIMKGLVAAEMFFPKMERMFTEIGVPFELTRLSLVESSFNLRAISRVGATGVWQFMLASAKEYMTVAPSLEIDERLSPLKSTAAAAKLLKRNYQILGSWDQAITAYNHGFRSLRKVNTHRRRTKSKEPFYAGCVKGPRLGWAGRNYYAEFLAVLHAEAYRQLFYGKTPNDPIREVEFVRVDQPRSAAQLAKSFNVSMEEFRMLNPDIRNPRRQVPKGFWVILPVDRNQIADAADGKSQDQSNSSG